MVMKNLLVLNFYVLFLLIVSCEASNDEFEFSCVKINNKTGELLINIDSIQVKKIILDSKKEISNQVITLNKDSKVEKIENLIKHINGQKNYLNTVVSLDKQGNFDFYSSYYYVAAPYQDKDNNIFISCVLDRSLFNNDIFAVIGDFDDSFRYKKYIDTILFDQKREVIIPVNNPRKGLNNIKFKIIDQKQSKDTIRQRIIYVDKDFYIK